LIYEIILRANSGIKVTLEKDFFGFKTDLFICCLYDPPSNSSYSKELDHEILGHIEKEIEHFQKRGNVYCAVILTKNNKSKL
jgi:hypothetical protein